jgi:hypothetical protein
MIKEGGGIFSLELSHQRRSFTKNCCTHTRRKVSTAGSSVPMGMSCVCHSGSFFGHRADLLRSHRQSGSPSFSWLLLHPDISRVANPAPLCLAIPHEFANAVLTGGKTALPKNAALGQLSRSNETIYKRSMEETASGAAWPGDELPLPMIHVNCSSLGSTSVHP